MAFPENKGVWEIKKLCGRHGISSPELSAYLDVVPIRIYEILHNKRRITADSDLRLTKFFDLPKGHFLTMQTQYDLELAQIQMEEKLAKIKSIDEVICPVKTRKKNKK